MNLSQLSIGLGILFLLTSFYAYLNATKSIDLMKKFPRSAPMGFIFMGLGTGWFLYNFHMEEIPDFEKFKHLMFLGFLVVGVGSMIFVRDFLAVRGLAIFITLLAHFIVEKVREVDSDLRLVLVVFSYILVIAGIFWTVRPYQLRDIIQWVTNSMVRFRVWLMIQIIFGVALFVMGLTVFKGYQ